MGLQGQFRAQHETAECVKRRSPRARRVRGKDTEIRWFCHLWAKV